MKVLHKLVIGALMLMVGLAGSTIWAGTWIAIMSEQGAIEAVRLGYHVWPGNLAQFTLGAFSVLFIVGGLFLLTHKKGPRELPCQHAESIFLAMVITRSKLFALVIAFGYVTAAIVMSAWDAKGVGGVCLVSIVPLALIWFPDEISAYCSPDIRFGIEGFNSPTPPVMVSVVGWLGLVGFVPLLAYLLS